MRKSNARATLVGTVLIALLIIPTALTAETLIFTADTGNNRIQVFDSAFAFVTEWGKYGRLGGEMISPSGLACGKFVYVADTGNHRIQKFNLDGTWLSAWGGTAAGQLPGMFSNPNSVAVNTESCAEFIYVADTGNNRIQKLDSAGVSVAVWGGLTASSLPGKFNNPQGLSADPTGRYIYVADTGNNRIQKLDLLGNVILTFGGSGTSEGKMKYPRDIAVDGLGRVYVADNMNYRIQRFSAEGVFELKWGTKGENDGQFWDHYGVAIDGQNNIFAADAGNNRVQVFNSDGVWLSTFGSISQGIDEAEFYYPMGVDVSYDRPVNPECVPTMTFTDTFTDTATATETYTETPTDTATETPTDTATETPTDTATETATDTATETATDTATETPTDTATETPTDTATEKFTETPTETSIPATATQEQINTAVPEKTVENPSEDPVWTAEPTQAVTPVVTATAAAQCGLCYSVELRGKVRKTCDMPQVIEAAAEKSRCQRQVRLEVDKAVSGGYVYSYTAGSLKIRVYDKGACYLDTIMEMQAGRHGNGTHDFTAWFVKNLLKKNVHRLIPAEYYIALLFPSGNLFKLEISKNPTPAEEMDGSNTYNYPNPFSGRTAIRFSLPESRQVSIVISDVAGRLMWQKQLQAYETIPGVNYLIWDGIDDRGMELANGTYILRVISGSRTVVKKLALVR